MHGFLSIDKPAGLTSHDVVARVRRAAGRGVKVGHAGTLDPAATGVLPVALGQATRLIEQLVDSRKGYSGLVRLGTTTSTDDAEGEVVARRPIPALTPALIEAAVAPLRGAILQVPPMYSALHHEGRRLYDLAREGVQLDLPARQVLVEQIDWSLIDPETIALEVICGKGTYIRALARDLGAALGCGAHLAALRRTFVGPFNLASAVTLDELSAAPERLPALLLAPATAVASWPAVTLDPEAARRVANGMALHLAGEGERLRAHSPDGTLLALLQREGELWRPTRVFKA